MQPPFSQLPATIGKYELLEFLGGGMSHVYRARDTVIGRPVVVKILTDDACGDADAKARFLQEVRVAGNIQHENIVAVFDFGEHEGRPFIVMEYLKGEDLRDSIRGGRAGSLLDRMKIALHIAEALQHVHERGIVHRDIKPENIHIDPNGRVKLMDFGIAKTADLSLTRTGMTMGTPFYMAPEQVAGKPPTPLVDIYAYGLLVFELLTGVRGVKGDTIEQVLFQILNQPLDPTPMENAGAPPAVRALVLRCVAKNPGDRPQSFRVVIEELRGIISGAAVATGTRIAPAVPPPAAVVPPAPLSSSPPFSVPSHVPSAAPPPEPKSNLIPIAIGLLALALAIGGFVWWRMSPSTQTQTTKKTTAILDRQTEPPAIPGMVYVPAGTFLFGEKNESIHLHAYYIDETEVSNAEYCRVMDCTPKPNEEDLPVVNITMEQARDFAQRVGKRLPHAREWERAARGTDGKKYPWGDEENPSLANIAGKALMPVRSFAAHPEYQMIGNAWEMVEGEITPSKAALKRFPKFSESDKWIHIRGGSFRNNELVPAYEWSAIPERFSGPDIGFRCVKDPPK